MAAPAQLRATSTTIQLAPEGKYDKGYKLRVDKNFAREREMGKKLSADQRLVDKARKLRELSGAPTSFAGASDKDRHHATEEAGTMAGAHEFAHDVGTLDAHVYATHLGIHATPDDPTIAGKRKNPYNRIEDPRNPLHPTNNRAHDKDLHDVSDPREYPEKMVALMGERGLDPDKVAKSSLADRKRMIAEAHLKKSTDPWKGDAGASTTKTQGPSNPVDPEFRAHDVGDLANVVPVRGQADPVVAQWTREAIAREKPIISGPSGHSLRFMNSWATKRREAKAAGKDISDWPTLEDARLMCLGNLLPPKHHHSYHEVMSASIGVSDGESTLAYDNPGSYDDVRGTDVGRDAHAHAEKAITPVEHRTHERRHFSGTNASSSDNPLAGNATASVPGYMKSTASSNARSKPEGPVTKPTIPYRSGRKNQTSPDNPLAFGTSAKKTVQAPLGRRHFAQSNKTSADNPLG